LKTLSTRQTNFTVTLALQFFKYRNLYDIDSKLRRQADFRLSELWHWVSLISDRSRRHRIGQKRTYGEDVPYI